MGSECVASDVERPGAPPDDKQPPYAPAEGEPVIRAPVEDEAMPPSAAMEQQAASSGSLAGSCPASAAGDARVSSDKKAMISKLLKLARARPHRVLGVALRADLAAARKSYLSMVRLIHPDKCDLPRATEAFRIAHQAFEKMQRMRS